MKKILFFIILMPALASLGHDTYFYQLDPSKGFHLSDTGALWDKYHKESHDQWKNKVKEFGDTVNDLSPIDLNTMTEKPDQEDTNATPLPFAESFTQTDEKGKDTNTTPLKETSAVENNITGLQNFIGFLLEQKALFVFGGFALIIFLLNAFFSLFSRERNEMSKVEAYKKKGKGGGYKYSKR